MPMNLSRQYLNKEKKMLNKNLDLLVKKNSSLTEMINSCKSNEIKIIETKDKKNYYKIKW